jgi:hypothetical protein
VFPPDLPRRIDEEWGPGSHVEILGTAFPGRDGDISTPEDNLIEALDQRRGALVVPFSVSMNCQDYGGATLIPWPTAQDPLTRSARPQPPAAPSPRPSGEPRRCVFVRALTVAAPTRLVPRTIEFVMYPHPLFDYSDPLGGPQSGSSQVILHGSGFHVFNEMCAPCLPRCGPFQDPTRPDAGPSHCGHAPTDSTRISSEERQGFRTGKAGRAPRRIAAR